MFPFVCFAFEMASSSSLIRGSFSQNTIKTSENLTSQDEDHEPVLHLRLRYRNIVGVGADSVFSSV